MLVNVKKDFIKIKELVLNVPLVVQNVQMLQHAKDVLLVPQEILMELVHVLKAISSL